jgi:hypothetical protein
VRPADHGSFILPFTVLRRIDCVLEKTKPAVIAAAKRQVLDDQLQATISQSKKWKASQTSSRSSKLQQTGDVIVAGRAHSSRPITDASSPW